MGQINLLRFIEGYGDVHRFAEGMLSMRGEAVSAREDEADAALLVSGIGLVFDVNRLFAEPMDDGNAEHRFEELEVLLGLEHGIVCFDLMVKQLREGVRYDKALHRWVRDPRLVPQPNCLSVTEWRLFRSFGDKEQWESYRRCKALASHLCGEGRERFCALLVADRMRRKIERMGIGA